MADFKEDLARLDRLDRDLAALRAHQRFVRDAIARHGYNPNQPRVPKGNPHGGEWTRTGAAAGGRPRHEVEVDRSGEESWGSYVSSYRDDGSLAEQRVFNRDGSRIVSEFNEGGAGGWDERHTVVLPAGKLTFETAGRIQRIYDGNGAPISASVWTDAGPEPLPPVQLAYLPRRSLEDAPLALPPAPGAPLPPPAPDPGPATPGLFALAVEGAERLFTWLSTRNSRDRTAVYGFTARDYVSRGTNKAPEALWVGYLTEDQVGKACPGYNFAKKQTNAAASEVERADYESPSAYGTAVHWKLHKKIEGLRTESEISMLSEFSLLKTLDETGEPPPLPRYGEKGSVRLDLLDPDRKLIFDNKKNPTIIFNAGEVRKVCNYDIKTEKSRLLFGRSFEIARSVLVHFPLAERIIVVEIKPRN